MSSAVAERSEAGNAERSPTIAPGLEQLPGASAISSVENNSKSKRKRCKPGRQFFVTLELFEIYAAVREDFVQAFEDLATYCVAVERSVVSKRVSFHLHAFLEFNDKYLLTDIRQHIVSCFPDNHLDIQACKSRKSTLKYITKEDIHCYFNCKLSELHFNKRVFEWASNTDKFDHTDPFVVEHRFSYNYLHKYFIDHKFSAIKDKPLVKFPYAYHNWTLDCVIWWNKKICSSKVKDKQLYLYGDSNVGKSTFVEKMIGSAMPFVFQPGCGKFFMQGFRKGFHKVILFEEFEYNYYPTGLLKRLLEGRLASYPVKCGPDMSIAFNGPIIFVSNFENVVDNALRNRMLFVSAQTPFWEAIQACLPKEEDSSDSEISISSDSDDETPLVYRSEKEGGSSPLHSVDWSIGASVRSPRHSNEPWGVDSTWS